MVLGKACDRVTVFKFRFKLPTVIRSRDSEDSPSSPNGALIKIPAVVTRSKLPVVYEPEAGHWARLNRLC